MTDRELLELAAKAAGIKRLANTRPGYPLWVEEGIGVWNPLTDDGDALRLAVKLNLQVTPGTYGKDEATAYRAGIAESNEKVHFQQNLLAATRRAIVRAAAEIGRSMA